MAAILSEGQASVAQRLKRIRRSQMLSIWVSRGNEMTSHNGTLSSSTDEVFVLVAPYVASHPIPSSLPLLPRAHLFREAGALNSLSEKPLQTGKCEFARFSSWGLSCELSFVSPWKAANVPKVFCPRKKLRYATFLTPFLYILTRKYCLFYQKPNTSNRTYKRLIGIWYLFYVAFI